MRPDPAFLLAIALAFCGVVAIVCGLLGQVSLRHPRCRRCRADVRDRAWDASPTCACGADLTRHGAVRFAGRERSVTAAVAGVILVLAGIGITQFQLSLRAEGRSWREILPAAWEIGNLRSGRDPNEALRSLIRRCESDRLDPEDRAQAIDAIIATTTARSDLISAALARVVAHPAMLTAPHAAATERALAFVSSRITRGSPTIRIDASSDAAPGSRRAVGVVVSSSAPSGWSCVTVVESLRVGERVVPGRWVAWATGSFAPAPFDEEVIGLLTAATPNVPITLSLREYRVPGNAAVALAELLARGEACPEGLVHQAIQSTTTTTLEAPNPATPIGGGFP